METIEVSAGEEIFKAGEVGKYIYVIKSGKVKISVGLYDFFITAQEPVAFGLEVLLDKPYTETCRAVEETKLIKCEKQEFLDMYAKTEVGKNSLVEFMRRTARALGWI
uniref:Cyclic nucleotide-binding domain-containing protein n=1 Tax=Fervidobacterium thailandense TaxID=1008305 RepID=A0A7C4CDI4_9BACT